MRAITRTRTLAALCALLMLLSSVPVTAHPEKPIDHPEGPPVVNPTEVGDPDYPHNLILTRIRVLLVSGLGWSPMRVFVMGSWPWMGKQLQNSRGPRQ